MKVLLAFDKFKGSLTAMEAIGAVEAGLKQASLPIQTEACPIADGGDGFVNVLVEALQGQLRQVDVTDAQGRWSQASYGILSHHGKRVAVIEMSEASGIAKVQDLPLEPHRASSFGTGLMMADAMSQGVDQILLGIGGSATNDGGVGMLLGLGFRFLNVNGQALSEFPEDLEKVVRIEAPDREFPEIIVACDVNNPLLGEHGATRVYGPQKGVQDFAWFETRLEVLAEVAAAQSGTDLRDFPGAGAAGGMGFALAAFLKAKLQPGFDMVSDILELERRVQEADLVLTGEGRMDRQSLNGKGPVGVALLAKKYSKPVIAVAGSLQDEAELSAHFDAMWQIKREDLSVAYCMEHAGKLLMECVANRSEWLNKIVETSRSRTSLDHQ